MAQPAPSATPVPGGWAVAAATRAGEGHARRGERGQDALCVRQMPGGVLVAALADGAGSAARGGAGAALVSRGMVAAACAALAEAPLAALADTAPADWLGAIRQRLATATAAQGLAPRDAACTLLLALSDGDETLVAHVGDGAVVARTPEGWRALSWPEGGEHAGSTYFVTDETPALRVSRHHSPVSALALLTDGLERLVLDFAAAAPHAPFFDRIAAPLDRLTQPGRDRGLSRALHAWLGTEAVAARTDDDRTLMLARRLP